MCCGFRIFVIMALLITSTVVNIGHLCFLGYWVRSEVNEDIPETPGFSLHMFTNTVLATFSVVSITLTIQMTYMVHRGDLIKSKYSCVSQINTFLVMSYLMFAAIATFLYINFPLYNLSAPFPPRVMKPNGTGVEQFNIPIWLGRFQSRYKCCGGDSYIDYKYMIHNVKGLERLPKSCCKKFQAARDPDHKFACEVDAFAMVPASAHLAIYTEGCKKKLEHYFRLLTQIAMGFCWSIFGLSFFSMLAFRHEFKLTRRKMMRDEETIHVLKCNSHMEINGSGENSNLSIRQGNISTEESTGRQKATYKDSKLEVYIKEYNPVIPQLFGRGANGTNSAYSYSRPRKVRRQPAEQQKRSQSHPYDYFSRHGLSNVL